MKLPLFIFFVFIFSAPCLRAQSLDFVPSGKLKVTLERTQGSYFQVYRTRSRAQSLLEQRSQFFDLDGSVTGQIKESWNQNDLRLQWGLSEGFNLWFARATGTRNRVSNLNLAPGASPAAQDFAQDFANQSLNGTGDSRFGLIWRVNYDDVFDFRLQYAYDHNDGKVLWLKKDLFGLGNGTKDHGLSLAWDIYPIDTRSRWSLRLGQTWMNGGEITTAEGTKRNLTGGITRNASLGWALSLGYPFIEGEIAWEEQTHLQLDSKSLPEGGNRFRFILSGGYSSLADFEEEGSPFPWDVKFSLRRNLGGINAPVESAFGVETNLYF